MKIPLLSITNDYQTQKKFVEIIKNNYKNGYPLMVGNDQHLVSLWSKKLDIPPISQDLVI